MLYRLFHLGEWVGAAIALAVVFIMLFDMWMDRGTDYDPDDRDYDE